MKKFLKIYTPQKINKLQGSVSKKNRDTCEILFKILKYS